MKIVNEALSIESYSMSHALEHYFHRTENTPMIDGFIESLLRTAVQEGPKLLKDLTSYKYRETMMYISTTAFNGSLANGTDGGDWATHRIEHALSAVYDIPHGGGLAILFPNWLEHVLKEDPSPVCSSDADRDACWIVCATHTRIYSHSTNDVFYHCWNHFFF